MNICRWMVLRFMWFCIMYIYILSAVGACICLPVCVWLPHSFNPCCSKQIEAHFSCAADVEASRLRFLYTHAVYIYVYTFICMYHDMYVYVCIHIHVRTHIHTHPTTRPHAYTHNPYQSQHMEWASDADGLLCASYKKGAVQVRAFY